MNDLTLLWTIQLAPLAAFLVIFMLPGATKKIAPVVGAGGALAAFAASAALFAAHAGSHGEAVEYARTWLVVADHSLGIPGIERTVLNVGFLVDPVNLLMVTLVTGISFCVQIFSYYYMAEDPSRPRYFAFLSFFSFTMTGLVLSNNLLQTFLFWELVGLTSYLLIGFWYEKPAAATAARKAFVFNRLADLGFYLGLLLLILFFGTVDFTALTKDALAARFSPGMLTLLGILVFTGVMGKSAQFPFHVWLPDAMEGPTPVSALIHSATMVAAGVFLLVRASGLFSSSETTLQVILVVGSLTALTGAGLATIQRDIKRIMAYSTVSQLGLMVMAVGGGSTVAAMFHLSTHACFKSLLFLTSGAFIHRFHTNDIWEIGKKGGKKDLLAVGALVVGLASLSGLPPFAGFFSKDLILEVLLEYNPFFFGVAVFVSLLTVYYSCRLLFVILFSKDIAHGHPAESPLLGLCRAFPLIALALTSLTVGYLGSPWSDKLTRWLGGHETHFDTKLILVTAALIVGGAAWAFAGFRDPEKAQKKLETGGPLTKLLQNKLYIDDAYTFVVKQVVLRVASALAWFEVVFIKDVTVNGPAYRVLDLGKLAARLQSGLLQNYLAVALGVTALAFLLLAVK
jgi:NADH-quinone oxidoreductase subunit L